MLVTIMAYRPLASLLFTLVLASSLPLGCGSEDGSTPPANTAGQPSAGAAGQGGSGQAGSSAGAGGTGTSGQGGAGLSGSSEQGGTDGGQGGSDGGTAGTGGDAGAGGSAGGAAGDGGTDAGGNAGASGDSGAGGEAGTAGDGGAGGSDAGSGGSDAGSGGSDAGAGGSDAGAGGSDAGSGGGDAGSGGSEAGSGGSDAGMGGSDAGAGGSEMAGNGGAGGAIPSGTRVRIMASNLTSGNFQSYDPGHGIRILQGVKPDIVLMQEFNYKTNSAADIQALANLVLGDGAFYYRETGQIPNGVISRYPILASGSWDDPKSTNREFAWARIDIPGDRDLWAVSVHLLTKDPTTRNAEAQELVNRLGGAQIPPGDLVVLGGDFNTDVNTEPCFTTLAAQLVTEGPHPADQNGNENTNAGRTKPYDQVLADADLNALAIPLKLGSQTFPAGLVVDTRVYQPLSDIAPAEQGDSAAPSMQHMGVARDFLIPNP